MQAVPEIRIQALNQAPLQAERDYVLYWMTAYRRTGWNFSLDRALDWARELKKPLVILEALRSGYPWASDRLHRFVLEGMAVNAERCKKSSVLYYPYVEPAPGAGQGLLRALGQRASVVVTDDFPCFFLPRMLAAAARQLSVRLEKVDSNGLLPLRAAGRLFPSAYVFRRFLQMNLLDHLDNVPRADPLRGAKLRRLRSLPDEIARRWPRASASLLAGRGAALAALPIDHSVTPVETPGGEKAARRQAKRFLSQKLRHYGERRNQPEAEVTSRLSPYLHFGQISAHEVFERLAKKEQWSPKKLGPKASGSRSGWWGVSADAEGFLDQLVTWRELGFNMCVERQDYDEYASLPEWARKTLADHARDPRPTVYTQEQFAAARTHDPLWNAAQRQLVREGRIHNYLRMLWGKKILEWSPSPQEALAAMIELNNKYALDGRDPNSSSGIFWILGRYDRPWAPERPIFGRIRYMSSENTARKLRVRNYIERYAP